MSELDPTQLAAREQFSRQSHNYGAGHVLENVQDVSEAACCFSLSPQSRVLDVACGAGHTGLFFARLGHRVTFGDISPAMLERTREAAEKQGLEIETREHTAEILPYPSATFDLVTCRIAPHHFSSPSDFVNEVGRVLRPDGYFLLIDGTIPGSLPEAGEWLNRLEKLRDPSHARLLAKAEWESLCMNANLPIIRSLIYLKKQPDLAWYFQTAATSLENQKTVREMIATASPEIISLYQIAEEESRIVWQWPILSLLARKSSWRESGLF